MAEERDVPTLEDLVTEIDATMARLDQPGVAEAATAQSVMDEIRNTILPLMKDLATSTGMSLVFVQDLADPIKVTGAEADETVALLKAFAASRPTDTALQERIAEALEPYEEEDDEGDDEAEESN